MGGLPGQRLVTITFMGGLGFAPQRPSPLSQYPALWAKKCNTSEIHYMLSLLRLTCPPLLELLLISSVKKAERQIGRQDKTMHDAWAGLVQWLPKAPGSYPPFVVPYLVPGLR